MNDLPLVLIPSYESDEERARVARLLGEMAEVAVLPPESDPQRPSLLQRASVLLAYAWRIRPDELHLLRSLRFVQSVWAGVDRVPVPALRDAVPGLMVCSGSGPNAAQVSEHAVGLYLDCTRRISWRDRAMRQGEWPQDIPGRRVAGSAVAVVGYGHVGRRVARMFDAMDASVLAVNTTGQTDDGRAAATLDGLWDHLGDLDGVVLAVPLTAATEGVVDRSFLEALPDDGVLVNIARGKVVVEQDLYEHLVQHPSFQAGLDVWWRYPRGAGPHRQNVPFETLPNVVMTPHSAFQVEDARGEMVSGAVANVRRFLKGDAVQNVVR